MSSSPASAADPAALDGRLAALMRERDLLRAERDALQQRAEKLEFLIVQLKRQLLGKRSEKMRIDPDQIALALEDLEQAVGATEEELEQAGAKASPSPRPRQPVQRNRGALPKHLPGSRR